jgi:hypothetical protein
MTSEIKIFEMVEIFKKVNKNSNSKVKKYSIFLSKLITNVVKVWHQDCFEAQ